MTAPTNSPATAPDRCQAADGCHGVQVGGSDACLAHLNLSKLVDWLATLQPGSHLDLRDTQVEGGRLARLLIALHDEHDCPRLGDAGFDGAQFSGDASFKGAQFSGLASFKGAQFSGDASFSGARFIEDAAFDEAQFSGTAQFSGALFNEDASFDEAQFSGVAGFSEARFGEDARFNGTRFSEDALFNGAQFGGIAGFSGALFSEAQFSGLARFSRAQFSGLAKFYRAQFKRAGTFGPVFAASNLVLDRAMFEQDILIEVVGSALVCTASRFAEAATLRLRYAEVVLDDAVFAKPSTIALAPDPFKHRDPDADAEVESFDEGPLARAEGGRSPQPRLLSLRGVDVTTLTLSELDLAACLFQGAHQLDQLRIEGARPFADTPAAWRLRLGRWWVPVWRRWSRRQTLAEEHHWRSEPEPVSQSEPGRGLRLAQPAWHGPASQTPSLVKRVTGHQVQRLTPDRLAVLYRALRKAQEDSKDEPGAADFYYGEMEMRRLASTTPWGERVILTLYWLVAGYGLRGLRTLTALAVVVVALAGLFHAVGFVPTRPAPSWWDSLLYTAGSTLSISDDTLKLTAWGKLLRILLRVLGPLLLGLALLSVRNRVKR
jgi:Pentapeptide repeats (9 copies)